MRMFRLAFALLFVLVLSLPAQPPSGGGSEVAEIVKLLRSGIGEDVITAKIVRAGKSYDLSADDLILLKQAGATGALLKTMMNPSPAAPAPAAASAPASEYPDEQGVYVRVKGEWKSIEPEVVNMRTANTLGMAFSYGIAKAKIKGDIKGVKSQMQVAAPIELLIKCAEGVSATEYQVVTMELKGDRREFEAAQMGLTGAKSGARKGILEIKFAKVGKATYRGTLTDIKRGEYGILPPGAATSASTASSGKVYAFGILE